MLQNEKTNITRKNSLLLTAAADGLLCRSVVICVTVTTAAATMGTRVPQWVGEMAAALKSDGRRLAVGNGW